MKWWNRAMDILFCRRPHSEIYNETAVSSSNMNFILFLKVIVFSWLFRLILIVFQSITPLYLNEFCPISLMFPTSTWRRFVNSCFAHWIVHTFVWGMFCKSFCASPSQYPLFVYVINRLPFSLFGISSLDLAPFTLWVSSAVLAYNTSTAFKVTGENMPHIVI